MCMRERRKNITKFHHQFLSLLCVIHSDIFYSILLYFILFHFFLKDWLFPSLMDQDKNLKNTDLVLSLAQYKNFTKPVTDNNPGQSL